MNTRRFTATALSLAALAALSVGVTHIAYAQDAPAAAPAAPAGRPQGFPRIDPIATALTAVSPTADEKTKTDEIIAKYTKEREAITPAPGGGGGGFQRMTPEQRDKLAALETKEVAEIKAVLATDKQAKFQTAYDEAKKDQSIAPTLFALNDLKLSEDDKKKIRPVLLDYADQSTKLRQDANLDRDARMAKMSLLWDDLKTKLKPLLSADQQKTLEGLTPPQRGGGRPRN